MIKNVPQYDDFHQLISNPDTRTAIVKSIRDLVIQCGYDGIHIDFEGINGADRPFITVFMSELAAELHSVGKAVTMALPAKTTDKTTGWAGAFDYAALAAFNDLVVVMAYDFHYSGSATPGAISPIDWVDNVAAFSASQIGPGKVLLGVPFYGYDWNLKTGPPAAARTYAKVMSLAAQYSGQFGYDGDDQAAWLKYVKDGDPHEVWYETATSLDAKLSVMNTRGLAGFGAWRLGDEDPGVWTIISALSTPTTSIPAFASTDDRIYFPETRHSITFGFLNYWRTHGGLSQFGYPRTEEFQEINPADGKTYTVQYFERARFEYHPEHAGTPYEVELGLLGRQLTEVRSFATASPFASSMDRLYFPETQHSVSFGFKTFWEQNGGLAIYGFPISEEIQETNPDNGQAYTVQYFERARFEYHAEFAGTRYEVELGLLGNQVLRQRGWLP